MRLIVLHTLGGWMALCASLSLTPWEAEGLYAPHYLSYLREAGGLYAPHISLLLRLEGSMRLILS